LALLFGADDLDVRAAGVSFGGGTLAFISFAAADMAATPAVPPRTVPRVNSGGTLSGLFSRGGWLGGFAAGFLGSGVLGLLFGRGAIGGLGGMASYVGLLCQLVLLAMLCRLFWTLWRSGDAAGAAALSPRQLADPYLRSRDDLRGNFDASGNGRAEAGREPDAHSAEVTAPRGGRG
jgi:predicted lipid-binding transport protein (Tim44 family)